MYLLNAQQTAEWVLERTTKVLLSTDFGIIEEQPDGTTEYKQTFTFLAPTVASEGSIKYDFTPSSEGLWELRLVKGTVNNYTEISTLDFYIQTNNTTVDAIG